MLKFSIPEKTNNLYYRLGDSDQVDSYILKNKINIMYMPYIFNNHDTKFDFTITTMNYSSSNLKSYKKYYAKISQHLASYTWIKFSYGYTPSFFIKSYSQSDPYILYYIGHNNYMPALFSSEKVNIEISVPIPKVDKTYLSP